MRFSILLRRNAWSTRSEIAAQFQQNSQTIDFDSYGQRKGSHGKGNSGQTGCFPIQTHPITTVQPGYCTIRLFLFGWFKTQLERRGYDGEDGLYGVVDEILASPSIEMIKTVFGDWMDRLQRVIDGNGDYIS
jgi:hypothetical protein